MKDGFKLPEHDIKWITFHGHLDYIQNPPHHLEVGLTQNRKTITLQNLITCWFTIFLSRTRPPHEHQCIGIASGRGHGDIWLHTPVLSTHSSFEGPWPHDTSLEALRHFLVASHNYMVTAVGSCEMVFVCGWGPMCKRWSVHAPTFMDQFSNQASIASSY